MRHKQSLRYIATSLAISIVGFLNSGLAFAHTPHDRVAEIQYSPNFNADNQIFAIVRSNLVRSIDGGDTWKRWGRGLVDPEGLTALAISPSFATDETMLVASKSGRVYRSENEGVTWTQAGPPLDPGGIVLFKFSRAFQTNHVVLAVGFEVDPVFGTG